MNYHVKLTTNAIEQMREIAVYITDVLVAPDAARHLLERMKAEMKKLSFMPARIPLTEDEPWRSHGIRRLIVQNFLVYFTIDDENRVVWVTAVIYGRRDQMSALIHSAFPTDNNP